MKAGVFSVGAQMLRSRQDIIDVFVQTTTHIIQNHIKMATAV